MQHVKTCQNIHMYCWPLADTSDTAKQVATMRWNHRNTKCRKAPHTKWKQRSRTVQETLSSLSIEGLSWWAWLLCITLSSYPNACSLTGLNMSQQTPAWNRSHRSPQRPSPSPWVKDSQTSAGIILPCWVVKHGEISNSHTVNPRLSKWIQMVFSKYHYRWGIFMPHVVTQKWQGVDQYEPYPRPLASSATCLGRIGGWLPTTLVPRLVICPCPVNEMEVPSD